MNNFLFINRICYKLLIYNIYILNLLFKNSLSFLLIIKEVV